MRYIAVNRLPSPHPDGGITISSLDRRRFRAFHLSMKGGITVPLNRRAAIHAGALGLMGLSIGDVARLRAESYTPSRAKSVIYVFLSGGLAQHESFDMKPEAPKEIRGTFNPIRTKTPGIHICEHLPLLRHIWDWVRTVSITLNGLQFWYDEVANYSARAPRRPQARQHLSVKTGRSRDHQAGATHQSAR